MSMQLFATIRDMYRRYVAALVAIASGGNPATATAEPPVKRADLLPDDVKEKWEREQDELKRKLSLIDSVDIQSMVAYLDSEHSDHLSSQCPADHLSSECPDEVTESQRQLYIGGVDVSFVKGDDVNACAALVVVRFPDMELVYEDYEMVQLTAPYIPGFLGFREVPFIVALFRRLQRDHSEYIPQVIMVDGNGILHPKGFGSACHLGVCLDIACIGVAKKLFQVDGLEKDEHHLKRIEGLTKGGDTFPLQGNSGKILGMALRSCDSAKNPVYVSPGHKVSMATAVRLVHRCCRHRVPEPVRLADINSREYLRVNFTPPDPPDGCEE